MQPRFRAETSAIRSSALNLIKCTRDGLLAHGICHKRAFQVLSFGARHTKTCLLNAKTEDVYAPQTALSTARQPQRDAAALVQDVAAASESAFALRSALSTRSKRAVEGQ